MHQHRISLADLRLNPFDQFENTKDLAFFSVLQTQFSGLEYTYEVVLGPFKLLLLVLNLMRESDSGANDTNSHELGSGSFGTVSQVSLKTGNHAVKRIPFHRRLQAEEGYDLEQSKGEQLQLRRCLKEYCFYKVSSLLGVGAEVVSEGYDLVCYNNCLEFRMELCEPISQEFSFREVDLQQCEK